MSTPRAPARDDQRRRRAHLIIHDVDRDGWGSAALLVEALGPESCELRPTKSKDVRRIVDGAHPEQHVWVLDIPAPPSWAGWDRRDAETTWVDHHLASWSRPAPMWIRAIVPETDRPTTTMSLLVRHGLASPGTGHELARRLCTRDDDAWGEVFDGLSQQFPDLPVTHQPPMVGIHVPGKLYSPVPVGKCCFPGGGNLLLVIVCFE